MKNYLHYHHRSPQISPEEYQTSRIDGKPGPDQDNEHTPKNIETGSRVANVLLFDTSLDQTRFQE